MSIQSNVTSQISNEMIEEMEKSLGALHSLGISPAKFTERLLEVISQANDKLKEVQDRFLWSQKHKFVGCPEDYPDTCFFDGFKVQIKNYLGYLNCSLCGEDIGTKGYHRYKIFNCSMRKYIKVHSMNVHYLQAHGHLGQAPYCLSPEGLCIILKLIPPPIELNWKQNVALQQTARRIPRRTYVQEPTSKIVPRPSSVSSSASLFDFF